MKKNGRVGAGGEYTGYHPGGTLGTGRAEPAIRVTIRSSSRCPRDGGARRNALDAAPSPAEGEWRLDELARRNLRRTALYWRGKLPMIDRIDRDQRDPMIAKYKKRATVREDGRYPNKRKA